MMERHAGPLILRIVTVDDSPIIAQRLKLLISEMTDVDLLCNAEDIQSALVVIEEKKPHVVFLDINLSHDKPRNGIDLLNILRKAYPVMKIIMLTNMSGDRYREICMSLGADHFFDKSEDFDSIPQALSRIKEKEFFEKNENWWNEQKDLWN